MKESHQNQNQLVHFTHGQQLTPEQLNGIGDFTLKRNELFSQFLVGKEGILDHYSEGLAIQLDQNDSLSIRVSPGAVINFSGEIAILEEPEILSLRDLVASDKKTFIIQVIPHEIFEEPFVDQDISEIRGYQYRRLTSRLLISHELDARGVEIARVQLEQTTQTLSLLSQTSQKNAKAGEIDTRYANRIRFYTNQILKFEDHLQIKKTLKEFRSTLVQLDAFFQKLSTPHSILTTTLLLQMETAERNFLSKKISFLLSELQKDLLDLMEEVRDLASSNQKQNTSFWTSLFDLIKQLESSSEEADPSLFKTLENITQIIRQKVLKSSSEQERRILVKESLQDLRNVSFGYFNKHAFGGVLFKLNHQINIEDFESKSKASTEFQTQKSLSAHFGDQTAFQGRGYFYSEGKVTFTLDQLEAESDTIVMLQIYKRRGAKQFGFLMNGELIQQEKLAPNDFVDEILNIGVLVPGKHIKPGTNELTLDIQHVDLDFGLFGVWTYQEFQTGDA